jgi:hypothetical protein
MHRHRRERRGLQGRPDRPRPHRRGQDPERRAVRRPANDHAVSRRGDERIAPQPSQLRLDHRLRPVARRPALSRDGVRQGPDAHAAADEREPARARSRDRHRHAGARRDRGSAPRRRRARRSQERQRYSRSAAREHRRRQDRRLRHRATRDRRARDQRGPLDQRHAGVHGARGDQRRPAVVRKRYLRGRHHPLRAARRAHAVLRELDDRDPDESPQGAATDAAAAPRWHPEGARRRHRQGAREASDRSVHVGERDARRAARDPRAHARAADDGQVRRLRCLVLAELQVLPGVRRAARPRQQDVRDSDDAGLARRGAAAAVHRAHARARDAARTHAARAGRGCRDARGRSGRRGSLDAAAACVRGADRGWPRDLSGRARSERARSAVLSDPVAARRRAAAAARVERDRSARRGARAGSQ